MRNSSFVQTWNKDDDILVNSLEMGVLVFLLLTAALLSVVYATETSCFGRCLVEASKMKDKAGGQVLPGLVRRRQAECQLFNS
jgi:hypothetical protein